MVLYVGEAVRIRASAVDPETLQPLDPPPMAASVDFWGPGKNPRTDPEVRGAPDIGNRTMTYRELEGDFILFESTEGAQWSAGKWTYRVRIEGQTYQNWEYGTFTLKV